MKNNQSGNGIVQLLFFGAIAATLGIAVIGGGVFWHFSRDLPKIITVADYRPLTVTRIIAKNKKGEDEEIGEFFKERRYVVPYEKIPRSSFRLLFRPRTISFLNIRGSISHP